MTENWFLHFWETLIRFLIPQVSCCSFSKIVAGVVGGHGRVWYRVHVVVLHDVAWAFLSNFYLKSDRSVRLKIEVGDGMLL